MSAADILARRKQVQAGSEASASGSAISSPAASKAENPATTTSPTEAEQAMLNKESMLGKLPDPAALAKLAAGVKTVDVETKPKEINHTSYVQPVMEQHRPMSRIRPERSSADQVIFRSHKPAFSFFVPVTQGVEARVSFEFGFLMTSDPDLIDYIRNEFIPRAVEVEEEGPLSTAQS